MVDRDVNRVASAHMIDVDDMLELGCSACATDFISWRNEARRLLVLGVRPELVTWENNQNHDLFATEAASAPSAKLAISQHFLQLAKAVCCHRNPDRWAILYRVLWRMTQNKEKLLHNPVDPDMRALRTMEKAIGRDVHKMHAFVRFQQVLDADGEEYFVAWFEPEHNIAEYTAGFFTKRFTNMRWSILTPDQCLHWNGQLSITPGLEKAQIPKVDNIENLWLTYYSNIFNPARLKIDAMQSEMPKKYWKNLPEAQMIPELIQQAGTRTDKMVQAPRTDDQHYRQRSRKLKAAQDTLRDKVIPSFNVITQERLDSVTNLAQLKQTTQQCQVCAHACAATQAIVADTVADLDGMDMTVMVIAEQPDDATDRHGEPFHDHPKSSPAALKRWLTTQYPAVSFHFSYAVKHFYYQVQQRKRVGLPTTQLQQQCAPWLAKEIELVRPDKIVVLGTSLADTPVATFNAVSAGQVLQHPDTQQALHQFLTTG